MKRSHVSLVTTVLALRDQGCSLLSAKSDTRTDELWSTILGIAHFDRALTSIWSGFKRRGYLITQMCNLPTEDFVGNLESSSDHRELFGITSGTRIRQGETFYWQGRAYNFSASLHATVAVLQCRQPISQ